MFVGGYTRNTRHDKINDSIHKTKVFKKMNFEYSRLKDFLLSRYQVIHTKT